MRKVRSRARRRSRYGSLDCLSPTPEGLQTAKKSELTIYQAEQVIETVWRNVSRPSGHSGEARANVHIVAAVLGQKMEDLGEVERVLLLSSLQDTRTVRAEVSEAAQGGQRTAGRILKERMDSSASWTS